MPNFKESIINALAVTLQAVGEEYLVESLQELHDKAPDEYEAAIIGGHAFVTPLLKLVKKSRTKIDDSILDAIHQALDTSAAVNGIVLPDADA